jgi:predicted MFS family arabinose efflux permease
MDKKKLILIIASMGIFVEALDIAIINLAIPSIQKTFMLTIQQAQWLQTLYVLFYGGLLIIGGKLSDTYSNKRMFITGCSLFLAASLGAGLATGLSFLLLSRALQGMAAAFIMPSAFSIINSTFTEEKERARAIGVFSSFAAIGSGSGLAFGGIITNYLGWQWIFFMNVPVLAIVIVAAVGLLNHNVGMATDGASGTRPLIDVSLFRIPSLAMGSTAFLILGAFFTGYLFVVSQILQNNMGCDAAVSGLLLVPFSVLSVIVARFVLPVFTRMWSMPVVAVTGMCCMLLGGVLLLGAASFSVLWLVLCAAACISGFGITICFTSFSVLSMQDVPAQHYGIGSGITSTAYFLGGGIGLPMLVMTMPHAATAGKIAAAPLAVLLSFAVAGVVSLMLYTFFKRRSEAMAAAGDM